MRNWLLDILACPFCRGDIEEKEEKPGNSFLCEELRFLRCKGCGSEFPVFLDRPILAPKGREGWLPATDEAVGWKGSRRSTLESWAWLGEQLESGKNLNQLVVWRALPWRGRSQREWGKMLEYLREQAEYRRSGEWFKEKNRWKSMLEWPLKPLPQNAEERSMLDEFAARVVEARPQRLLDVASGGGFGLTHSLAHIDELECAVAVEKDLKCLWTIQYRVEHIGHGACCEAVGGDVRRLSFKDESFDFTTAYQSLGEICGISDVLLQVYRVLEPGGRFLLSFINTDKAGYVEPEKVNRLVEELSERTPLSSQALEYIARYLPKLGEQEFLEFMEAADLFVNLGRLTTQAQDCGFKIIDCSFHPRDVQSSRVRTVKDNFILLMEK